MTNNKLTDSQLERIIESADDVLSALAGTNEDVHRDDSTKMCQLWDDLNDTHATPEVVRAMARELQEYRKADLNSRYMVGVDPDMSNDACLREINEVLGERGDLEKFSQIATAINDLRSELQEYRKASKEPSCDNCAHYQPQTCHGESCPARDATYLAQVLAAHKPTFIPTKKVCIPVLPDYVFHTMAVRWPLTAEHLKRLCRELQLEMEKHQEAPGEQP